MKFLLLAIGLLISILSSFAQPVRINEVMSSNGGVITDADGDTPDWIELYNAGAVPINLGGYGLSDKEAEPFQWIFPDYKINPGEYLLIFASEKNRREQPVNWNTIISKGDDWKYLIPSAEPASNWRTISFDDSGWLTGKSGFGFGDNDDATTFAIGKSVFLRKKFTVSNPADITQLVLHMDYDDGFVAFLNGVEIARAQMGSAGDLPGFDALAAAEHEALIYRNLSPEKYTITNPGTILKAGENVLAIQVHNQSASSSDLTAIPFLSAGTCIKAENARVIDILKLIPKDFHTNFKINADGESLYLTNPSGTIADSITLGVLSVNTSFGRTASDTQEWAVFPVSTPRKANSGAECSTEKPGIVTFSRPGGVYSSSLQLKLTATSPADTIYYTLDGSSPTRLSPKYSGEINISSSKVVRARILKSGMIPGETVTNSYIMHSNNKLPTVSISMNPEDLWDYNTGIYVKGPNAEAASPFKGANFWQDWEKACHFELMETTGNKVIDVDAGVKIFGNYSRAKDQKSMAFYCRKSYGAEFMKYKIFEERQFDEFKDIVIRNSGNDWNNTMFRDGLMTGLTLDLNVDQQAFRPAVIFLNGEYWGILNLREKVNEHFLASNHNIDPDKVILLEKNSVPIVGSASEWKALYSFMEKNTLSIQSNYDQVVSQIDLDNYLNYTISQIFYANHDWPGNNIKYWKTTDPGSRWRWIIFDTDFGMGLSNTPATKNSIEIVTAANGTEWHNVPWATLMLRRMLENKGFRDQFVNRFADLMNSTFLPVRINKAIDEKCDLISEEMSLHLQRWNGGTQSSWMTRVYQMKLFASARPVNVFAHIRQKFSFQSPQILTVNADSLQGTIKLNSLLLTKFPWKGTYFPDVPVTMTAIPRAGYRFIKWEGVIKNSNLKTITIAPQAGLKVMAVFESDGSHYENIVINEISFNNEAAQNPGDWIEIYNKGKFDIDISGWKLTDSDPDHQFIFGANTWIKANDYLVITNDLSEMKAVFGGVKNLLENFTFSFGLSNTGDAVRLYSCNGQLIDEVIYKNSAPWQTNSLNELWSLELKNPALNNNSGTSWVLSENNGTPGFQNTSYSPDPEVDLSLDQPKAELLQNYPNPFHEGTSFEFYLDRPEKYTISIMDVNGLTIRVLNGNDGLSTVFVRYWDGNNESGKPAAPGVYFYRLEGNGFSQTKRMIKL